MKQIVKCLMSDIWFHIFATISITLIVGSFFLPPIGIIDSSVFMGVGELFGFAALWEVHIAIKRGTDAKITHNNTTVEINHQDDK